MSQYQQESLAGGIRTWVNDGSTIPYWIQHRISEDRSPNGTFIIPTALGLARVHIGHVVLEYRGKLWSRKAEEVPELLAGFAASLSVDSSYQRSIDNDGSRRLIASIAANFDWRLCAPLVVSRRQGDLKVIIDGQHRWAAAIRRGDLPQLPCCLFTYDSPEDEARMFIVANRARKAVNRMDDFHAALAAGDEDALDIQRLVSEAGLAVSRSTSATTRKLGEVTFTSSIATARRRHGDAIVSAALTSMAEAYKEQPLTHGASIFGALVRIFVDPPEDFDSDKLVPTLRRFPMAELSSVVRDEKGGDARALLLSRMISGALSMGDDVTK